MKQIPDNNELICLVIRDRRLLLVRDSPRDKWTVPHGPIDFDAGLTESGRLILDTYFSEFGFKEVRVVKGRTALMMVGEEYKRCILTIYETEGNLRAKWEKSTWSVSRDGLVTHVVSPDIAGIIEIPELLDRLK